MNLDQKRADENVTQFQMRRIRNAILEEAALIIDKMVPANNREWGKYAAAIRALKT
jgi:hypothetical protein